MEKNITETDKETEYITIKCGSFHKSILWVNITIRTVLHLTWKQQSIGVTSIVVKKMH